MRGFIVFQIHLFLLIRALSRNTGALTAKLCAQTVIKAVIQVFVVKSVA
jgi:hypothetical protein